MIKSKPYIAYALLGFSLGFLLSLLGLAFKDLLQGINIAASLGKWPHYIPSVFMGLAMGTYGFILKKKEIQKVKSRDMSKYLTLFDSLSDAVCILDNKGNIMDVNKAAVQLYEYTREELKKMNVSELIYSADNEKSNSYFKKLEEEGYYQMYEGRIISKSGKIVWIQVSSTAITQNGRRVGSQDIIRDISEQKRLQLSLQETSDELARLNESKDKFISIIAHDLISPFNSLLGFSEMLVAKLHDLDPDKSKSIIEQIHFTIENTYTLLTNLLDWARSQQGHMPFNPETIRLSQFSRELIMSVSLQADHKKITLSNRIDENLEVFADKNMLAIVIRNLITNALKFTQSGGRVNLSASVSANHVEICVTDNGLGMSKTLQDSLLKIGTKTSTAGTVNEKGTGLGLLLCKEFVEIHGGDIWIESELTKGSSFKFTLPANSATNTVD